MDRNEPVSFLVFKAGYKFHPVLVAPKRLSRQKVYPVLFGVNGALLRVELKVHNGILTIP